MYEVEIKWVMNSLTCFSLCKNACPPPIKNYCCKIFPICCYFTVYYQQHLNPFYPSSASSCTQLSLFISLFIHLSTVYTVLLLTLHLHLPPCRALGEQRPSAPDGLAPTAKMNNSPRKVRGCRGEEQRWDREDQEACKSFCCWVGFGRLVLPSDKDSVVK